jgi:hypothetical protein
MMGTECARTILCDCGARHLDVLSRSDPGEDWFGTGDWVYKLYQALAILLVQYNLNGR